MGSRGIAVVGACNRSRARAFHDHLSAARGKTWSGDRCNRPCEMEDRIPIGMGRLSVFLVLCRNARGAKWMEQPAVDQLRVFQRTRRRGDDVGCSLSDALLALLV